MEQQLLDYFYYACQRRFGDELIDVKVNNSVPHQAFVQIVVKTVTPEIKTFARDFEQEFAELDRHIDIQVVSGRNGPRILDKAISVFHRFTRSS